MIAPRPEVSGTPLAMHGGRLHRSDAAGAAPVVRHDFSVCLNAFGPPPVVVDAIRDSRPDEYPDPYCRAPRAAAAARWGRPIDELAFGAGATELIYAVCFAYLRPGDHVLVDAPAFGEYARAAALCGARTQPVDAPVDVGDDVRFRAMIDAVRRTGPRLVFCAAPTSPFGTAIGRDALGELAGACGAVGALLVLDQAYDAFAAVPLGTPALPGHRAVLHLRSLTKEYALAGVRAAFAIGPAEVVGAVERVRVPWSASNAAQAAAVAALGDDGAAHAVRTVAALRSEAVRLAAAFRHDGCEVRRSTTHFFVARVGNAPRVRAALLQGFGILVRDCSSFGLPEWMRVAARTAPENDALLAALRTLPLERPSFASSRQPHAND